MTPTVEQLISDARFAANQQIEDPRERAIIVRYLEDALCRLRASTTMETLPKR